MFTVISSASNHLRGHSPSGNTKTFYLRCAFVFWPVTISVFYGLIYMKQWFNAVDNVHMWKEMSHHIKNDKEQSAIGSLSLNHTDWMGGNKTGKKSAHKKLYRRHEGDKKKLLRLVTMELVLCVDRHCHSCYFHCYPEKCAHFNIENAHTATTRAEWKKREKARKENIASFIYNSRSQFHSVATKKKHSNDELCVLC